MQVLIKWGAWGALGILIGLFLVTMAEPTNIGGIGILMIVGISIGLLLRGLWRLLSRLLFGEKSGADDDN